MPASSRKTVVSAGDRVVGTSSNGNRTDISTRDHDEGSQEKDIIGLYKTGMMESSKTNDAKCNTSFERFAEKAATKNEEERAESLQEAARSGDEEEVHEGSVSRGSLATEAVPICASPTRTTESSGIHLFSPRPSFANQPNHRADYDQLDLDDTMMGEAPFHFEEESPQRDLARQSPGGDTPHELTCRNSSRKRGPSRPDFSHPSKRSQVLYGQSSHHAYAQEDPSGNATSSSKIRNPTYYNSYGHHYSAPSYHGESRTPNRGTHLYGGYTSGYSPYHGHYTERTQRDSRAFPVSALSNAPYESDDESPPSPPPSPRARASSSTTAVTSTPEKVLESIAAKSPFRSPPRDSSWVGSESKNNILFRPSPFFQRSPGISGSFDMGTPNGTLMVDDDNLGPIFQEFEESSTPGTLRSLEGGGLMSIGRSPSHGNPEVISFPSVVDRDRQRQRSPMTHHTSDLPSIDQPISHGNNRSSPRKNFNGRMSSIGQYHQELHGESFAKERHIRNIKYTKASTVTTSGTRGGVPSSRLDPGAQPKELWPPSSDSSSKERISSKCRTPGPVRLEIGGTGSLTTRKTFEGINTMMQPRPTNHNKSSIERKSASGYITTPGRHQPLAHRRSSHHSYPTGDITTPRKPYSQTRPGQVRHHYSYPACFGSGRKPMYPPPPKADSHYSMHKPMYMNRPRSREGNPVSQPHHSIPPSDGKENSKKKGAPKRSPCNCKKSRCLKLYCECFAAERFCQGCNCVDCGNTPESGEVREKAIKDTRAKNSKAFQNRFSLDNSQGNKAVKKVHNVGCKCKKSACLKKYCECFNAGALCGDKCKCLDCLNYAGSQALIDKRRKIKDRSGTEYAIRVSDEQWKSGCGSSGRKVPAPQHRRHPIPSPVIMPPHHTMYPSPRGHPPQGNHGYSRLPPQRQYYMGLSTQMLAHGHPHSGYAPMNIPVTPGYHRPAHRMAPGDSLPHGLYRPPQNSRTSSVAKPVTKTATKDKHKTTASCPKTPGVRTPFDPATSRKKRKTTDGESEPTEPYFGETRKQPKTTALAVFSYLSNNDLYHASLVCRRWGELAFDDELWKFQ